MSKSFADRINKLTNHIYIYEMIKTTIGLYDADQWRAYEGSWYESDVAYAKILNSRPDKFLELNDRRTLGYKFLQKRRKEFNEEYEKDHPRPPSKLNGLKGII